MKQLNKNNFIVWQGNFAAAPFSVVANNDTVQITKGEPFLAIYPLINDAATYGINAESLEITFQDNVQKPAVWDSIAQKITYYLPAGAGYGTQRLLKYRFRDKAGNLSNEATITIGVAFAETFWRGLETSFSCLKDSAGENTGLGSYATLEKVDSTTSTPVVPAEQKPNVEGDANYIAPFQTALCPLPEETLQMGFFNRSNSGKDSILAISLFNGGEQVRGFFVDLFSTTKPQPKLVNVLPGHYDEMRVTVQIRSGINRELEFKPGAGGAGGSFVTANPPVRDGSVQTITVSFLNITFGTDYAGDLIMT